MPQYPIMVLLLIGAVTLLLLATLAAGCMIAIAGNDRRLRLGRFFRRGRIGDNQQDNADHRHAGAHNLDHSRLGRVHRPFVPLVGLLPVTSKLVLLGREGGEIDERASEQRNAKQRDDPREPLKAGLR